MILPLPLCLDSTIFIHSIINMWSVNGTRVNVSLRKCNLVYLTCVKAILIMSNKAMSMFACFHTINVGARAFEPFPAALPYLILIIIN